MYFLIILMAASSFSCGSPVIDHTNLGIGLTEELSDFQKLKIDRTFESVTEKLCPIFANQGLIKECKFDPTSIIVKSSKFKPGAQGSYSHNGIIKTADINNQFILSHELMHFVLHKQGKYGDVAHHTDKDGNTTWDPKGYGMFKAQIMFQAAEKMGSNITKALDPCDKIQNCQ